jgi:hypothetical protein
MLLPLLLLGAMGVGNAIGPVTKKSPTRTTNTEVSPAIVRSTNTGDLPQAGNATAFGGHNKFYVGLETASGADSLSRIAMTRVDGEWKAEATGIASADLEKKIDKIALLGTSATAATGGMNGPLPVVLTDQSNTAENGYVYLVTNDNDAQYNNVQLNDANEKVVNKASPAIAATAYSKLEDNFIFVAVPESGKAWKDSNATTNQGIALVKISNATGTLEQQEASLSKKNAFKLDISSAGINVTDAKPVAFGTSPYAALQDSRVDMYWDPVFEHVYVGLVVTNGTVGAEGGALSVVIFKKNATTFTFKPFVHNAMAAYFVDDNKQGIIGYNEKQSSFLPAAYALKVRVMHTSTGKDYLILNGGVENGIVMGAVQTLNTQVHALPLLPKGNTNAGQLAKIEADGTSLFATVPTNVNEMPNNVDANKKNPFIVGVSKDYIGINGSGPITDMQVVGDTVYVSVGVDQTSRDQSHKADRGLFSSTAIFNKDGAIRAWTPWQRVTGAAYYNSLLSCDPVYGFGVDATSNNIWYLTSSNNDPNDKMSVSVTTWDEGDIKDDADKGRHTEKPLSAVLNNEFTNGVIINLFTFDGETPGFVAPVNNLDYFNMIVATGYNKVALIQTWKGSNSAAGLPTQKFEKGVNIFVHDVPSLGNITSAEVSRIAAADKGWLFVGGDGGLAVLCKNADGKGWDGKAGLDELKAGGFPGDTTAWKWKKLEGPNGEKLLNIRKIVADGYAGFVYVMTRDAIYRFTPNETDFAAGKIDTSRFKTLIDITAAKVGGDRKTTWPNYVIPVGKNDATGLNYDGNNVGLLLYADYDELLDMMIISGNRYYKKTSVALATSHGVLISNEFKDDFTAPSTNDDNPFFKVVPNHLGNGTNRDLLIGPAIHFDSCSALRGGKMIETTMSSNTISYTLSSNVYVKAIDKAMENVNVYRFDINPTATHMPAIAEPYIDNGTQVDYFYQIGTLGASASREFNGPADFMASKEDFGGSNIDFISAIPVTPDPAKFLSTNAIKLDRIINSAHDLNGIMKIDPGSGAKYFVGEFGVLVNE